MVFWELNPLHFLKVGRDDGLIFEDAAHSPLKREGSTGKDFFKYVLTLSLVFYKSFDKTSKTGSKFF